MAAYRISDWLSEVDTLALSATAAAPAAEAGYLRAMGMLLRLRPEGLGGVGLTPAQESEVMRCVATGAYETAALRLLPDAARVMTSTPGCCRHLATIQLRGQRQESTSSGRTFALALVSALALSLVDQYHELAGLLPG